MDRFWLETYCELAKDALVDLAMQIEMGTPPVIALHAALYDVEHTRDFLNRLGDSFELPAGDDEDPNQEGTV